MKPQDVSDYQHLLTEVIKKLIVVLGPDITFAKLHSLSGLHVETDGTVLELTTDPRLMTRQLSDTFTELSGFVVKKIMGPLETYAEQFTTMTEGQLPPTKPYLHPTNQTPTI